MAGHNDKNDDFVLTLGDIARALGKRKRLIFWSILCFSLLAFLYKATAVYQYAAEGTFKVNEQQNSGGLGRSLLGLMNMNVAGSGDSDAAILMKSKPVLQDIVHKLNLQASIVDADRQRGRYGCVLDNLYVEYVRFQKRRTPIFSDRSPVVVCTAVDYDSEIPITYRLRFDTDKDFSVFAADGILLGKGCLGMPFRTGASTFTIAAHTDSLRRKHFFLTLSPLHTAVHSLKEGIRIEHDKKAKNILRIFYKHSDRQTAVQGVNLLMQAYRTYLWNNLRNFSQQQLDYLSQRKEESIHNLSEMMEKHAKLVSKDIFNSGFPDTEIELKFLLSSETETLNKLDQIDLHLEKLEAVQDKNDLFLVQHYPSVSPSFIDMMNKLQDLQQKKDTLSLAVRDAETGTGLEEEEAFLRQKHSLEATAKSKSEIREIIASLKNNLPLDEDLSVFQDAGLYIQPWYREVQRAEKMSSRDGYEKQKSGCLSYLNNLAKQYEIYESIINERLARRYRPQSEYEGLDLESANRLLLQFTQSLHDLESQERKSSFVLLQLDDSGLELSSLSYTLDDPVSKEIIGKSSTLSLTLRDEANRSTKELERTRNEIAMQRSFLRSHLKQMGKILSLNQTLIREKMRALQNVMLELIQRKISIIETQLRDYVAAEIRSKRYEKEILQRFLNDLHQKISRVPQKWVSEQLLKEKIALSKASTTELARIVEGKNISQNLEVVQSNTVDAAFAPILPASPKISLFTILGGLLGGFFGVAYVLAESVFSGVSASPENLRLAGKHISGSLYPFMGKLKRPLLDRDLSTLRMLISFLGNTKTVLLLLGAGPDYSEALAALLNLRGERILLIDFDINETSSGLLQYLQGEAEQPNIVHATGFDRISSGGFSRYIVEHATSDKFSRLLKTLSQKYDRVLAVFSTPIDTAEAAVVAKQFEKVAATVSEEPLSRLRNLISHPSATFFFLEK